VIATNGGLALNSNAFVYGNAGCPRKGSGWQRDRAAVLRQVVVDVLYVY
jgi:hypothetical protein